MAKKIIIVGGGAAGLMAAIQAARQGAQVTLLEQNEKTGKKLLVTGNGKCNLTNLHQDIDCYRGEDPQSAWEIIRRFPVQETIAFFSGLGIYTKNRNGGIYPNSEQAQSVLDVLMMEAQALKVKVKTRERVTGLVWEDEKWQVSTEGWKYSADAVIVTAGGSASSVEGSGDSGYTLAKGLKIPVVSIVPALCALKGKGEYFSKWAGVRVDGRVRIYGNGRLLDEARGELQLTEYGISGIPVFQVSRYAARALEQKQKVEAVLDFFPDFPEQGLHTYLINRQEQCPYKTLEQSLVGLLPDRLLRVVAPKGSTLEQIAGNMKHFTVDIRETRGMKQAQVAAGGVALSALNENLESKQYKKLFFAGEVVDVDGTCGGYNLQWAWSSGAVAGMEAAKE